MKYFFLPIIFFTLFLSGPCLFLDALEIELTGGINNMAFDPEKKLHTSGPAEVPSGKSQIQQIEGFPYVIGDFSLKNDISDVLGYNIQILRDPILQNNLIGKMTVNTENINLEFGAFFGIDDDIKKPDIGILGSIELIFPGIIFLSVNGSTSLGIKNELMGNNSRETAGAKLGFWLPNILPIFSAEIKTYTREEENSLIIRDELVRFIFSADIFAKNSPFTLRIDAGYETFNRSYESETSQKAELKAVFAGFEIKWQIIRQFRLIAGFEMPLFIIEPEKNTPSTISLFKAYGGLAFTFF